MIMLKGQYVRIVYPSAVSEIASVRLVFVIMLATEYLSLFPTCVIMFRADLQTYCSTAYKTLFTIQY